MSNPAVSKRVRQAFIGRDLPIGLKYQPSDAATITIDAEIVGDMGVRVRADQVTYDPETGQILATWQEASTFELKSGRSYEARFGRRDEAGNSRIFYIKPLRVR